MSLITVSLMQNESGRFLPDVLRLWHTFSDFIIVLDDASTDDTADICTREGAKVVSANLEDAAWGHEAPARERLFDVALAASEPGDYLFFLDADMIPARSPVPLLESSPDGLSFPLFDLWEPKHFRNDNYWCGHLNPRVWLIRRPETPKLGWVWNDRGIHTGHFPLNLNLDRVLWAPLEYGLLHYAYSTPELRQAKSSQYASVHAQLSEFERAHAASIMDPTPRISPLPFEPELSL